MNGPIINLKASDWGILLKYKILFNAHGPSLYWHSLTDLFINTINYLGHTKHNSRIQWYQREKIPDQMKLTPQWERQTEKQDNFREQVCRQWDTVLQQTRCERRAALDRMEASLKRWLCFLESTQLWPFIWELIYFSFVSKIFGRQKNKR